MNILHDIIATNKSIITKGSRGLLKNWLIIFTGIAYSIILAFLWKVAPVFSIFAGILITLVQSALISNYLYLIKNIVQYERITFEDFKKGFTVYLWKVYGIMIIIWFVNYAGNLFLQPILQVRFGFVSLWKIVGMIAFILLNCLPEVIYQKQYHIGESFRYSFEFIKENWIDWYIPNVIIWIIFYIVLDKSIFINLFFGQFLFFTFLKNGIFYLLGQFLLAFMMVYRGFLFQVLSTTTRRKRMFMRNVYK